MEADEIILAIDALLRRLAQVGQRREADARPDGVLSAALRATRARRKRDRLFGSRLFAEPGWDILLDLFVAKLEGRKVSVSSACLAASAATTTALRHIGHLAEQGLIARKPHPSDARSIHLEITEEGAAKLTEYFSA
jgi:hypothetical protein